MFKLSQRSKDKLTGVKTELIAVVTSAIEHTTVDFGVIQGIRTLEEQKELRFFCFTVYHWGLRFYHEKGKS